jgi:hypothetical protein
MFYFYCNSRSFEAVDYFLVIDNVTGGATMMTLAQASALTGIAAREIVTAVEATGRCNSIDFLIIDTRPANEVAAA